MHGRQPMTTPTNLDNELVRRLTITERPGYEPDGYGFARRVEDKLCEAKHCQAPLKVKQKRWCSNLCRVMAVSHIPPQDKCPMASIDTQQVAALVEALEKISQKRYPVHGGMALTESAIIAGAALDAMPLPAPPEEKVGLPGGYGFAKNAEDKLFGMALAINKREQERKIMVHCNTCGSSMCPGAGGKACDASVGVPTYCSHGNPLKHHCGLCVADKMRTQIEQQGALGSSSTVAHTDAVTNFMSHLCKHGVALDSNCLQCCIEKTAQPWQSTVGQTGMKAQSWASPETLTAQLRRLRFEIQTTQTRLAEADKLIEKVLASL